MKVTVKTMDSGSQEFELSDEVGQPLSLNPALLDFFLLLGDCGRPER